MESSSILKLTNLSKKYPGAKNPTLEKINLTLKSGELLGLLGPSGCGKTTLLRIVAGFEKVSRGTVELGGEVISDRHNCLPPEKRNTGMVFQDYALFPHLTVEENIAFGLKNKQKKFSNSNRSHKEIRTIIRDILELVSLSGLEKRYPHELSGGQQQRVALARALAPKPALILLDEPLSNLDVQVRHRLREEIRAILKAAGTSAIFVTHDREEALAISDKIAVMRFGRLEQVGTPEQIYTKPASRFVGEFVTQANFVSAKVKGKSWITEIGELKIPTENHTNKFDRDRVELMLRQEDIRLTPNNESSVIVRERQFLGREYRYCLETSSGKRLHARTTISDRVAVGTKVNLSVINATPLTYGISNLPEIEEKKLSLPLNK